MKILHLLVLGILAAGAAHAEEQCLVSQSAECTPKAERKTSSTTEVNLALYRAPHSSGGLLDSSALVSGRHTSLHREASVMVPVASF